VLVHVGLLRADALARRAGTGLEHLPELVARLVAGGTVRHAQLGGQFFLPPAPLGVVAAVEFGGLLEAADFGGAGGSAPLVLRSSASSAITHSRVRRRDSRASRSTTGTVEAGVGRDVDVAAADPAGPADPADEPADGPGAELREVPPTRIRSAFTPAGGFSLERWMTPSASTQR